MTPIHPESFAMICFLVLMQNGEGFMDKSPIYIGEKMWLLHHGIDAFAALDIYNKRKVKAWCEQWGIEMPKEALDNLVDEEAALLDLASKGIFL